MLHDDDENEWLVKLALCQFPLMSTPVLWGGSVFPHIEDMMNHSDLWMDLATMLLWFQIDGKNHNLQMADGNSTFCIQIKFILWHLFQYQWPVLRLSNGFIKPQQILWYPTSSDKFQICFNLLQHEVISFLLVKTGNSLWMVVIYAMLYLSV